MENCDRFYSQRNSAWTFPYLQDIPSYGNILSFVEIAVDISDFAPPIPQSNERIRPLHGDKRPTVQTITGITETKNAENIVLKAMWDFTPANRQNLSVLPKSSAKYKYELERIEQGVRTVDDINQAKTGLPEGILPTGHQTGTSFQEHGNVQVRNKLLKRRGGSEKRNPLFKRCWHISLRRTPLTAAGEVSTASKWKMLRLSLRLLYWLFSHGENFQSATYGDNIRRGCDFF